MDKLIRQAMESAVCHSAAGHKRQTSDSEGAMQQGWTVTNVTILIPDGSL